MRTTVTGGRSVETELTAARVFVTFAAVLFCLHPKIIVSLPLKI